jgi:hypothetical protein
MFESLRNVSIRNCSHNSGEWNFLVSKFNDLYFIFLYDIQRYESGSPEHVLVRKELDQFLT